MFVCICKNVTSTALNLAIEEAPLVRYDPFQNDYVTDEDQVFEYVTKVLKVNTGCGNCELFIRQYIRDRLQCDTPVRK